MDLMAIVLFIIVVIAIVGFVSYGLLSSTPSFKGKEGENRVHDILMQLPDNYFVFKDVILETQKGTTQIDHIVVSRFGVFAIETKNYRGEIYGDDKRRYWTQIIVTDVTYTRKWYKTYTYVKKSRFYNPVKQSLSHSYAIKDYLSDWPYLVVVPIVVFCGNAVLSNVESKYRVIYDYDLIKTILSYTTTYLTDSELQTVIHRIAQNDLREIVDDTTHIRNIKEGENRVNSLIASGICPKCGGKLVARYGKYGIFWGCSNYPKCRFTIN